MRKSIIAFEKCCLKSSTYCIESSDWNAFTKQYWSSNIKRWSNSKGYLCRQGEKWSNSFLVTIFRKETIYTNDGVKVGVTDNSASKLSRLTYHYQQEIALFSDELLRVARFITKTNSYKKKKGEFRYYVSYIFLKRKVYSVVLNVFTDANGTRLYDINKISQITASGIVHGSSGYNHFKS